MSLTMRQKVFGEQTEELLREEYFTIRYLRVHPNSIVRFTLDEVAHWNKPTIRCIINDKIKGTKDYFSKMIFELLMYIINQHKPRKIITNCDVILWNKEPWLVFKIDDDGEYSKIKSTNRQLSLPDLCKIMVRESYPEQSRKDILGLCVTDNELSFAVLLNHIVDILFGRVLFVSGYQSILVGKSGVIPDAKDLWNYDIALKATRSYPKGEYKNRVIITLPLKPLKLV